MHLLECVFSLEHCICTQVESSPLRMIPLLNISSPCRGILFYRYRERARRQLIIEAKFEKKAGLWLWVHFVYTCIRMFFILICVV